MVQLLLLLQWFWGAVVFTIFVGAVTNRLFGPFDTAVWPFLHAHVALIVLVLLAIGALTLWSWLDKRRREQQEETQQQWKEKEHKHQEHAIQEQQLRQHFALYKPAPELRPDDFKFQWLKPGDEVDPRSRPFYATYIRRRAVTYNDFTVQDGQDLWGEDHIAQEVYRGRGFVLLGQPLDGKTRTLYEIVRRLAGYYVVQPLNCPTPPDEAFALFQDRRVILLLEDLNDYAPGLLDLREFTAKLSQYADTWTVTATCRDGPELGAVRGATGTSLHRFYEDIPLKFSLLPLTVEEKAQLAQGIGRRWSPQDSEHFHTPGSMTMEEPLRVMRERFQPLRPMEKDALRGLKLLTTAGILPFTHHRLQAVLKHVFNRVSHLGDCLDILAEQSFIHRPARQDPIQPKPAYLQGAVAYIDGKTPQDDFSLLSDVLEAMADIQGLLYLGITFGTSIKRPQDALAIFERVLQLRPELPEAWQNKAAALELLKHYLEAIEACKRVLRLSPKNADAWYNVAVALVRLGSDQEAVKAYERVLLLRPDDAEAWYNKGVTLSRLQCYLNALEAFR